jgi:hypothetical protein
MRIIISIFTYLINLMKDSNKIVCILLFKFMRALVTTVIDLRVPQKEGNLLTS